MKKILSIILLSSLSAFVFGQSITLDPRTTQNVGVEVNADLAFRKTWRENSSGTWTSYNRQNSSVIFFQGGTINGIADGQNGLIVYIFNGYGTGSLDGPLTFKHDSSSEPVSRNRILTLTKADFVLNHNGGVMLMYDGGKQRWRILATDIYSGNSAGWGLAGNSGTTNSNFIGTTDANDLVFKTNNEERIRIDDQNPQIKLTGLVNNPVFGQVNQNYQKIPLIASQRFGGTIDTPTSLQGFTPLLILSGNAHDGVDTKAYAQFGFYTEGNFGDNPVIGAKGASIGFATRKDKNSILNERMTITGEGETKIKGDVNGWGGARLNVDGTLALSKGTYEHWTSSDYIALNPSKSVFKISGGITYDLKWVDEDPQPADGQLIFIYVLSSTTVNIKHNYNIQGATRIITNTGGDVTISNGGGATLIYDKESNYWRVIGIAE